MIVFKLSYTLFFKEPCVDVYFSAFENQNLLSFWIVQVVLVFKFAAWLRLVVLRDGLRVSCMSMNQPRNVIRGSCNMEPVSRLERYAVYVARKVPRFSCVSWNMSIM